MNFEIHEFFHFPKTCISRPYCTWFWNATIDDTFKKCQVKWMVSRNETFPSRDSRLVSKKCGSLQKVSKHCCGCANTVATYFFFLFFKLRFPLPLVFQVSMHGRYHNLPVIKPHQDSLSNLCVRSNYGIFFMFFFSSFHEKYKALERLLGLI